MVIGVRDRVNVAIAENIVMMMMIMIMIMMMMILIMIMMIMTMIITRILKMTIMRATGVIAFHYFPFMPSNS